MPMARALAVFTCIIACCAALPAQDDNAPVTNTIVIRLRDGRTGLPVKASNYLVRVDHDETLRSEWVHIADDGTVTVTVPAEAKEISVKATYDMSTEVYVNCDAAKENDRERNIWYPISGILKTGVVAPNECSKTNYKATPGEFMFFVRKRGWLDRPDR